MTSRERVRSVISGGQPDRVPLVIGASNATGIKMGTWRRVKELAGIEEEDRFLYGWPELGTAFPGEAGMRRLHSDVRGVHDRFPEWVYDQNRARPAGSPYRDSWGSGALEISPGEWYPGVHPLKDATTIEEIDAYDHWPDMNDPDRVSHIAGAARALADANEYAIMATPWLLFPLERAFAIRNPIQTSAGRIRDLNRLKGEYGSEIIFCGGVDTHRIRAHGSPDEIRDEVRRVMRILGRDGGYMVASVHTIMNDVPPENVLAMVDAVEEFGWY